MSTDNAAEENTPLLAGPDHEPEDIENDFSIWQRFGLYSLHALSMWNYRSYDFAAVLFVASAYPHTLTVASLRGLCANLASLLLSPAVGRWCNRNPSRLRPLQTCIVLQRICICVACVGWSFIVKTDDATGRKHHHETYWEIEHLWWKNTVMAGLLLLGMVEKLSWAGNIVIIERDWVPTLTTPTSKPSLHVLNANIKRIDLLSKLATPLAISGIILGLRNLRLVALLIAVMQTVTVGAEIALTKIVWKCASVLQTPKKIEAEIDSGQIGIVAVREKLSLWTGVLRQYLRSPILLPSLAWTIQPLSVLNLSTSMIVYLLSINFSLAQLTLGRSLSTGVEIISTILVPLAISWLRGRARRNADNESQNFQPLITAGTVGLVWQLCMLVPAVISLLILPGTPADPSKSYPALTKVLLISLGLSRLGPFAYALVEQQLVQIAVPEAHRLEFSGIEMALFSFAELCRWGLTGVFGKPEQFKGVAVVSFVAIVAASACFWLWTWNWKGNLHRSDPRQSTE